MRNPEAMTNTTESDTFEHWFGPVRSVYRTGERVALAPPRPGETEPFAWVQEPDTLVSMDIDGRPVESATFLIENGRGVMRVKFEDGESVDHDRGPVSTTSDT